MLEGQNNKEQALLEGIARSDRKALLAVYEQYFEDVRRYVMKNNGTKADAEDMFQEGLIVIFRKVKDGSLKLTVPLGGYLFSICRYQWLERLRRHSFHKETPMIEGMEAVDLDQDTESTIEQSERKRIFQQALLKLPENCRRILEGYFQKVKYEILARELKTTAGYIKKRKAQCQKQLFSWIEKDPMYGEVAEKR